jgi:Glycoside Hydrolase Family 113
MTRRLCVPTAVTALACLLVIAGCGGGGVEKPPPNLPTITSVSVTCFASSVGTGQTNQCLSTVQGTGNFNTAVTWSASVGSVSGTGLFTAPGTAGPATITATSVAASKSGSAAVTVVTLQKAGFTYEGLTHVSWQSSEYNTAAGTTAQDGIAASGATWGGVLATWYMPTATSTSISTQSGTPRDAAVVAAIQEMHAKGLKVMLKPHVDVLDGTWRGAISPSDANAWFSRFTAFIVHYAQLAQSNGVELLCFGTEYKTMSVAANLANWTGVINAIRANYTGPLAYAANATYAADEFTSVSFWSQVDVIGLDAYFPLTNHSDPTLAQLVSAWSLNTNGENIVADIQNFAGAHPRQPVIFTEIGYKSVPGTNTQPWNFSLGNGGPADNSEQQNCYEAMYEVWRNQKAVMSGNFWWAWPVPTPVAGDTDYNPRGKAAELVTLHNWQ